MFVGAFQNWLKVNHFNESLAQKPTISMDEVMNKAECYIKGEESNMDKISRDAKEKVQPRHEGSGPRKDHHKHGSRDRSTIKPSRRPYDKFVEIFTPLNSKFTNIMHEVYHLKLIPEPNSPKRANSVMGKDENVWCAYHRLRGHHTKDWH